MNGTHDTEMKTDLYTGSSDGLFTIFNFLNPQVTDSQQVENVDNTNAEASEVPSSFEEVTQRLGVPEELSKVRQFTYLLLYTLVTCFGCCMNTDYLFQLLGPEN